MLQKFWEMAGLTRESLKKMIHLPAWWCEDLSVFTTLTAAQLGSARLVLLKVMGSHSCSNEVSGRCRDFCLLAGNLRGSALQKLAFLAWNLILLNELDLRWSASVNWLFAWIHVAWILKERTLTNWLRTKYQNELAILDSWRYFMEKPYF